MKTVWGYSSKTESARLIHVASHIASGFFQTNHFWVLPFGQCPNLENCVSLPSLPYLSIPRFWNRCSRISTKVVPLNVPSDLLLSTAKLLAHAKLPNPDWSKTQKHWSKIETKIIAEIYKLIPAKKNWIKKIIIWPTVFGTTCSFNLLSKPGTVYIWLRVDQEVGPLVEAILTSLTRMDVYNNLAGLWPESEIIADWLLAYSPLSKYLPAKLPATIKRTRTHQSATLLQTSQQFLQTIGAPIVSPNQVDTSHFSTREKQLFELLLSRSPNVVTFDEINELLTNNYEQFSLYAISKSIQRLRDKLEKNGISGSFIQTKRGEGYLLTN